MSKLRFLLALLIALLVQGRAVAQVKVDIDVKAPDDLGAQVAGALRDSIRKRGAFQLVTGRSNSDATLKIVTLDPMDGRLAGMQTVYSLVITMKTLDERRIDVFVNNYLGVCGREQVSQCGVLLAEAADEQISMVMASLRERARQAAPK